MNVEGIRNRDARTQYLLQPLSLVRIELRKTQTEVPRGVSRHRHVTARGAHHQHATTCQRATGVKDLQGFAQRAERFTTRNTCLTAECIKNGVRTGQRTGVSQCGSSRHFGASRFDQCNGLTCSACPLRGLRKPLRIFDALDVQAKGADPLVATKSFDQVFEGQSRLIAHGQHIADGQRPIAEHHCQRNRTALTDECHATLRAVAHILANHLIRP